ncbi:MAG: CARDB domain-containing protein [Planctomycetota bacterium]|nr:CARDB domain-containing protein [Planctomycetota bacterium]
MRKMVKEGAAALAVACLISLAGCATSEVQPSRDEVVRYDPHAAERRAMQRRLEERGAVERPAERPVERAPEPRTISRGGCAVNAPAGMTVQQLAFPTGSVDSSGLLVSYVTPRQVRVGSDFDYEIHACNLTSGTLQNVIVTNTSFSNLELVSSNPQATAGPGGYSWNLGDLGPNATQVIRVRGRARSAGQLAAGCVTASYNNSLCATTEVVQPALAITKIITPQDILICQNATMTITVSNPGTGAAENVRVVDNLPAGLTADGQAAINQEIGTLGPGESRTLTFALSAAQAQAYENVASASAAGIDQVSSDRVPLTVRTPQLTINAECSGSGLIGRNVVCRFVVTNTGNGPSTDTVITAPTPSGSQFVSADNGGVNQGGNVVWTLGNLNAGESRTVVMTNRVMSAGNVVCSATVNGSCNTSATNQCNLTIQGVPDIGTLVTDDDGVVVVGNDHTYRVEVANQGQVALTNVRMVVTMPQGMTFVSSPLGRDIGGNKVEFNFGNVPAGQRPISTFVVRSSVDGELLVIGETTCNELKTPIRDDELTVFIQPGE